MYRPAVPGPQPVTAETSVTGVIAKLMAVVTPVMVAVCPASHAFAEIADVPTVMVVSAMLVAEITPEEIVIVVPSGFTVPKAPVVASGRSPAAIVHHTGAADAEPVPV